MAQIPDNESPAARAIRVMGGPVAAARKLGVDRYQTVQSWVRNGVPARYCLRVEAETGVSRRELRPDDWRDSWPLGLVDSHAENLVQADASACSTEGAPHA